MWPVGLWQLLLLLSPPPTGTLEIRTPHYGVTVVIDREPVGRAPVLPQSVTSGLHLVEVLGRGREPWSRVVLVRAGETRVVDVRLPPPLTPSASSTAGVNSLAEPQYDLSGTARFGAAHMAGRGGGRRDIDLNQWWLLRATRLAGWNGVDVEGAVAVRAIHDLDGVEPGDALATHYGPGDRDGRIALEASWLAADAGWARLDGGRWLDNGPGGRPLIADGVRARVGDAVGGLGAGLRLGRTVDPLGPQRGDRLAAGGSVGAGEAGAHARIDYLFHQRHHVDAIGQWRAVSPIAVHGRVRWIDDALAEARARVGAEVGPFGLWTGAARREAVWGPYEAPTLLGGRYDPARHAWTDVFGGASTGFDLQSGLRAIGDLRFHLRRVDGRPADDAPGLERWDTSIAVDAPWWLAGLSLERASISNGDTDLPASRLALRLDAGFRPGRWRIDAWVGLARHEAGTSAALGQSTRPETGWRVRVAVARNLELQLDAAIESVHPDRVPAGGPLATFSASVRLR